jgi:hypothetical protein
MNIDKSKFEIKSISKMGFRAVIMLALLAGFIFGKVCYKKYKQPSFNERVAKMNSRIEQLRKEGYNVEDARKIGVDEADFKPLNSDYTKIQEK